MRKLAIVITHPIQYYSPWFRLLAEKPEIQLKVFYTWSQSKDKVIDKNFGKEVVWDIPLLDGYEYEFINNISKNPGSNRWNGINNPELVAKVENFSPDALLIFGWNMKSHFRVMKHFRGKVPVWFRGDSNLIDEKDNLKKYIRRVWLRYVYSHIDKAFYVGKANKKYFEVHGLKGSQLVFAPHAIDNSRFSDSPEKKYKIKSEEWRKKLGFEPHDLVVLFAGKFESKKSPIFLIKAIQEVNKERNNKINLLLVGNGSLEKEIQTIIKGDPEIITLPFQNQSKMPEVYRLGDILCLPSNGPGETWGLAINEVMASGKPFIISDKVGCAQDMIDSRSGFVFEANNSDQLKYILSNLTKEGCKEMSDFSANYIDHWHFNKITEAITIELKKLN